MEFRAPRNWRILTHLCVAVLALASATGAWSEPPLRAVIVDARADTSVAETARRCGFTHVVVQVPYFRGAGDIQAVAMLRRWSMACEEFDLTFVPRWPVCGPIETVLDDPFFPVEPSRSSGGAAGRFKPSLLSREYWDAALFDKLRVLIEDDSIQIEEFCFDLTCTIDGETYYDGDGYEEEYLRSFPPFTQLLSDTPQLIQRIAIAGLSEEYRQHVIAYTASAFRDGLAALGDAGKGIRFSIDGYLHNRLYEGVARGLARTGLPTRCILHGTSSGLGRTAELQRLANDASLHGELDILPRFDLTTVLPEETAGLASELEQDFGGCFVTGFDAAWVPLDQLRPVQLLKGSIQALEQALAPKQTGDPAHALAPDTIQQLRNARQDEYVTIRGPLNRYPLFPGENHVTVEIVTILQDLEAARLETTVVFPDLTAERLGSADITFSEGQDAKAVIPVTVRRGGYHQLVLTVRRPDDGVLLSRKTLALRALPAWEATLGKSYYTTEGTARIRIRRYDGQPIDTLRISATMSGGDVERDGYLTRSPDPSIGYLLIDIGDLPPAEYSVALTAAPVSDDPSFTVLRFDKRPPAAREVKFLNHRGGILEIDGRPRFVLGAFGMDVADTDVWGGLGANVTVNEFAEPTDMAPLVKEADRTGVGIGIRPFDALGFLAADANVSRQQLDAYNQNAVLFYYTAEEPEKRNISPYALHEMYAFIRESDPYRPQAINVYAHPLRYDRFAIPYIPSADIMMMSYFPLPRGPMTRFDYGMERAVVAAHGEIPVWAAPQAFDWRAWDRVNFDVRTYSPSERELRYVCYSTVVHGGRGILFWSLDAMRRHPEMIIPLKKVVAEFSTLHRILVQEDALVRFTLEPFTGAVDARGKWYQDKLYLFASNGDWFPERVLITFQDIVPAGITEWRSGKEIETLVLNNPDGTTAFGFQDEIEGAGVRLYIIEPKN